MAWSANDHLFDQCAGTRAAGQATPVAHASLTTRTTTQRLCWQVGGAAHRPATVQEGPSSGFSLIIVRLVSSEMRTVASKGICATPRRQLHQLQNQ